MPGQIQSGSSRSIKMLLSPDRKVEGLSTGRPTMNDSNPPSSPRPRRRAWNKGKMPGPKPPLRPGHVWAIRAKLQLEKRTRDLAMFNLAIDSKLRGCDLMALRVDDAASALAALHRERHWRSPVS